MLQILEQICNCHEQGYSFLQFHWLFCQHISLSIVYLSSKKNYLRKHFGKYCFLSTVSAAYLRTQGKNSTLVCSAHIYVCFSEHQKKENSQYSDLLCYSTREVSEQIAAFWVENIHSYNIIFYFLKNLFFFLFFYSLVIFPIWEEIESHHAFLVGYCKKAVGEITMLCVTSQIILPKYEIVYSLQWC